MKVGNRPSKRTRHSFTLSAEDLMEEAARREMGARIRELREQSPYKQQHMADRLSIGLRMYQRIEQRGTTEWERVEQLATIHGADPHWIWSGKEKPATPSLNGESGRLARIEEALERVEARQVEALSIVSSIRHDQQARPQRQRPTADEQEVRSD